jgi:hypothetical protein
MDSLRIERFREIIVGPEFEAEKAVAVRSSRREHDHRHGVGADSGPIGSFQLPSLPVEQCGGPIMSVVP